MNLNDILQRKFCNGDYHSPLRWTRLTAEDMAVHKSYMKPLLKELTKSYNVQAMLMCACWERFERMFSLN